MDNKLMDAEKNIVFYEDENNNAKVEVRLQNEELDESSTCAKITQVQKEGNRIC